MRLIVFDEEAVGLGQAQSGLTNSVYRSWRPTLALSWIEVIAKL